MDTDKTSFLERFSIDKAGNLYVDDFWIYVNKDYKLDFYKVNLSKNITKVSEEMNKKENPLQVKVIEKELDEIKSKMNDNEDYEYEENEVLHLQNYLYNPEMKFIKPNKNNHDEEEDVAEAGNLNDGAHVVRRAAEAAPRHLKLPTRDDRRHAAHGAIGPDDCDHPGHGSRHR